MHTPHASRLGVLSHWLPLAAAVLLMLAACAPAASTPAPPPAAAPKPAAAKPAELIPVQFGVVVNMQYVPAYVGVEKGIFNKHGLDVKVKFFAAGPEATKALEAGDIEVGAANFATAVSARASGAKLKGFWLFQNDPTIPNNDQNLAIIVPPNSPIQRIADLSGKRVGITLGGAVDPYMRLHLQAAGVDPSKVELVNATFVNMPSALMGGGLDAALFSEPYGEIYLDQVPGGRVLMRGGGKVSFRILAIARDDWLQKNQAIAKKVAVALAEASQYTRQHLEEGAEISARWLSGLKPEVARKAIRHYTYDPRYSSLVAASWDQEGKTLLDQKRTTKLVPLADGFDIALTEAVVQKYPQFFSDLKALPK